MLPSGSEDQLAIHCLLCFGWWLGTCLISGFTVFLVFLYWEISIESLGPCSTPFLGGRFIIPPTPSTVHA
jgi:hypothetical protein